MENLVLERAAPDRQAVGLKAFARIADAWSLTLREAAEKRAPPPGLLLLTVLV